ncbi:hypothetical protein [Fictibacillus phosphorivorans]|uniref:hypothetical protein n=1 Tax=Fictibacillus phosphorivorans TaxID=1221500 RepID=UPI00203F9DB1|nr:hypothetical protein [Fictibacillus phosphorivorans]MCM3719483.1 hypothetical protein [Fictibacillus phosphorivorans]MCM3777174.1 hypothetical protein [Fictibacillus phosphorivorans]
MITLCSQNELKSAQAALVELEQSYPELYEKFIDVINLTRAMQLKYQYMGSLIMNEDPGNAKPEFVIGSVIRLYQREMKKLTSDKDIEALRNVFLEYKHTGYSRLSQLALGKAPESLAGSSAIIQ